jgi:hypothetical protein
LQSALNAPVYFVEDSAETRDLYSQLLVGSSQGAASPSLVNELFRSRYYLQSSAVDPVQLPLPVFKNLLVRSYLLSVLHLDQEC